MEARTKIEITNQTFNNPFAAITPTVNNKPSPGKKDNPTFCKNYDK